MANDHNKDGKSDKHAQREALSSLGTNNHLLKDALRGRRGNPGTRSQTSNRDAPGASRFHPIFPTVPTSRTTGQASQLQRSASHRSESQRSQSSRAQEQQARQVKRRERERRERDVSQRERTQRASTKHQNKGQSSQLHRQSSSRTPSLSAGAGPSTLRRQSSLHPSAGSSGAGTSNLHHHQGLLRQSSLTRAEPRPEDQFIREGGRGFRCILCRDQSYISMQFSRRHVLRKHADALPHRDRPIVSIRTSTAQLCEHLS